MKTFILEWDPARSSMSGEDYLGAMPCLEWGEFRSCFQDEPRAGSGDNFFLLRTGTDSDGLIARGFFLSDPYMTGNKECPYRMDLRPTFMASWEDPRGVLSIGDLKENIRDFPWGAAGRCAELSGKDSERLSALWKRYLERFTEEDFDEGTAVVRSTRPEAGIEDTILIAAEALYDIQSSEDNRPAILSTLEKGLGYNTDKERIHSILNDVLRLTDWAPGRLREKGFDESVVDSVIIIRPTRI